MFCIGDPSFVSVQKPLVFVSGLRTLDVQWNPIPGAIEYIVKCINISSGQSTETYAHETLTTFDQLSQSDLYEFQIAAIGKDGRRA